MIDFKKAIRDLITEPKGLLAIMVIFTWCISVFLPEYLVDEVTQRSFERIVLVVCSYFFGSAKERAKHADCPYLRSLGGDSDAG